MPTSDSTIAVSIVPNNLSLALDAYPSSSGSFQCAPYSNHSCGTYSACQETYTYGTSICVKAIPGDNMEFLSASNSTGCPVPSGWTSDGICKGIEMSEDKTVSALKAARLSATTPTAGLFVQVQ